MKRIKEFSLKIVICTIVFGLTLNMVPIPVLALLFPTKIDEVVEKLEKIMSDEPEIIGEIEEKRDTYEKHYLMSDGTISANIYADAVHYKENGKYIEYDNTLTEKNGIYTPKSNDVDIKFSKSNTDNATLSITNKGYVLNWGLVDAKSSTGNVVNPKKSNLKEMEVNGVKSDITYKNVLSNIDLRYDIISNKVEEFIVINNKEALQYEFTYNVDIDGLSVKQISDNELVFVDAKGTEIFYVSAPLMYDAASEFSDGIKLIPTKVKTGYTIKMELDRKWLDDEAREYPIVVDPTITTSKVNKDIKDTYIYNGDANNTTKGTAHILRVGNTNASSSGGKPFRSLIQFSLPPLKSGDQIVSATLNLYNYDLSENPSGTIQFDIHAVTQSWTETAAYWATMNTKYNPEIIDYIKYSYSSSSPKQKYTAKITSLVKEWYLNGNNYGIMLKEHTEVNNPSRGDASFVSSDVSSAYDSCKPSITIVYRNQTGLENYLTTHTQSVGRVTTYTNDYNGNLTLIHYDASTPGSLMPASVYHVYNTNDRGADIGYGNGYRLNLNQTIEVDSNASTYLMYTDEDGTRHYFYKDGTIWKDEDGLGLKITESTANYILEDKGGNKSTFIKPTSGTGKKGYLKYIEDTRGNRIDISYNPSNYNLITRVYDGGVFDITLAYTNNMLTSITDPSGRIVNYTYTGKNLTSITYPDNEVSSITYDANNLITKVTGIDGYYINYGYYTASPFRVKSVKEYSSTGVEGNGYTIVYGHNTTKFTDTKGSVNTYTFNDWGQTLSISDFGDNNSISDAYGISYQYETKVGATANRLLLETPLTKSTNNYVVNSSAESDLTRWSITNWGASVGTATAVTAEKHIGNKSFKINTPNNNTETVLWQSTPMEADKIYTLSAYIKGSVTNNQNANEGVFFFTEYKDVNNVYYQEYYKIASITSGWDRYSTTFTMPSNGTGAFKIGIVVKNTAGTIYIDGVQLEDGKVANTYNLIDNGNFVNGLSNWIPSSNNGTSDKVVTIDGTTAFTMVGELKGKNILQNLDISGVAGDTYSLSYWAKNMGAPIDSTKQARIAIEFFNSAGTSVQKEEIHVSADSKNWQYVSSEVVTTASYNSIKIYLTFNQNTSNIYYTNIGLFKDEKGTSYTYDAEGNLIGATDSTDQKSTMQYTKKDQLALSINSKGRRFQSEYDYNTKDRLLKTFNQTGITNSYEYDDYGNVMSSKTEEPNHVRSVSEIDPNKTYYIKPMYSNLYVGVTGTNVELKTAPYEWKFQSISADEFYIYNTSNQRIEVVGGATANSTNIAVATQSNVAKQQFKLVSNNDGTFSIKTKVTSYGSAIDISSALFEVGRNIHQYTSSVNNLAQTFQIIEKDAPQGKFIETSSFYVFAGNYKWVDRDQRDKVTRYAYNNFTGTISSVINANNITTSYTYDLLDRTTSITTGSTTNSYTYNKDKLNTINHNNFNYSFVYDNFGNTTNIKVGTQNLITNTYEPNNGYLTQSTYGNGQTVNYTYDQFGRTSTKTNQTGTASYLYDNRGNLSRLNYNNSETNYTYDLSGRISSVKQNDNYKLSYQYDQYNNLSNKIYKLDNTTKQTNYVYDIDDKITNINEISYIYDTLDRLSTKKINNNYTINYSYLDVDTSKTTTFIENINNNGTQYKYEYDDIGNVISIKKNNVIINEYEYDSLNQLIKEDNSLINKTYQYTYDNSGNILSKKEYQYKTTTLVSTKNYSYTNSNWKDQLTSFNGQSITYDAIGNPLTYDGNTYTWANGRELQSIANGGNTYSYQYNESGIRTSKTVNNVTTNYYLEGTNIIYEDRNGTIIYYFYDESGIAGFEYQENTYYYVKNLQGDIIEIVDSSNQVVASYKYDAWGNVTVTNNTTANLGDINPFRYRGYYNDSETNLYYLNSRYYNPEMGRFINADGIIGANRDILSYNLYAYCSNNPVMFSDPNGQVLGLATLPLLVFNIKSPLSTISKAAIASAIKNVSNTNKNKKNVELKVQQNTIYVLPAPFAEPITLTTTKNLISAFLITMGLLSSDTATMDTTKTTSQRQPQPQYWEADAVAMPGNPLTYSQAQVRISTGGNVMCINQVAAYALVKPWYRGTEPIAERHFGTGYYYHYHLNNNVHGDPHIWFKHNGI